MVVSSYFKLYTSDGAPAVRLVQTRTNPIPGDGGWDEAIPSASVEMAFLCEKSRIPFWLMWYSGVLVFWYSGLAPRKTRFWGTGTVCIWHVARGGLDFWGKGEGDKRDSLRRVDRLCKTKPISAAGLPPGPKAGTPCAPNKPNSFGSEIEAKPFSRKELCRAYLSRQLGKTKPIRVTMPIRIGLPNAEVCVWGPRSAFPGTKRAKRTQFFDCGLCKTKPIWPRCPDEPRGKETIEDVD